MKKPKMENVKKFLLVGKTLHQRAPFGNSIDRMMEQDFLLPHIPHFLSVNRKHAWEHRLGLWFSFICWSFFQLIMTSMIILES